MVLGDNKIRIKIDDNESIINVEDLKVYGEILHSPDKGYKVYRLDKKLHMYTNNKYQHIEILIERPAYTVYDISFGNYPYYKPTNNIKCGTNTRLFKMDNCTEVTKSIDNGIINSKHDTNYYSVSRRSVRDALMNQIDMCSDTEDDIFVIKTDIDDNDFGGIANFTSTYIHDGVSSYDFAYIGNSDNIFVYVNDVAVSTMNLKEVD